MLLLTSDCSGHLVTLPAPPIRCLCVDFVRVTNCFYDYDYIVQHKTLTDYSGVACISRRFSDFIEFKF